MSGDGEPDTRASDVSLADDATLIDVQRHNYILIPAEGVVTLPAASKERDKAEVEVVVRYSALPPLLDDGSPDPASLRAFVRGETSTGATSLLPRVFICPQSDELTTVTLRRRILVPQLRFASGADISGAAVVAQVLWCRAR